MDNNTDNNISLDFGLPEKKQSIIKVIGVGGGGGNAVTHMYREGIHDVTFALCNTDKQALDDSPVPVHLQLGKEGLGAGNNPERARQAALETIDSVKKLLNDGTRMAFITAGMGGGTGTGAGPVIAKASKDMGILTVGIVTIPFAFEGRKKILQALDGVEKMAQNVDALLVINNERLRKIYPDLLVTEAFAKADDTLSVAAKSIAEIITVHGMINLDFNDVKTVLKDGGVAIMSTGYGEGEGRVKKAIEDALNSPLLNDNDVYDSKKILLSINFSNENKGDTGLRMEEMNDIHDFLDKFEDRYELKWGMALDPELGKKVKVTILATGFGVKDVENIGLEKPKQPVKELPKDDDDDKDAWVTHYYGADGKQMQKKKPYMFIFSPADLDNEEVIVAVENSPTFSRKRDALKKIEREAQGVGEEVKKQVEPKAQVSGKIRFTNEEA